MAMKSIILITIFVVVLVATQVEAQILPPRPLFPQFTTNVVVTSGNVSCSVNGSVAVNVTNPTSLPPFPNALVELRCGGIPRGIDVTNQTGGFTVTVRVPLLTSVTNFISSCRAVVTTPLSTCNATLPSTGTLQAPLQNAGNNVVAGTLNITRATTGRFQRTGGL